MKNKINTILLIILTLVLCLLRGIGVISIPWIWCFGPLWIPVALVICICAVAAVAWTAINAINRFRE